jgi:hypothetical protein
MRGLAAGNNPIPVPARVAFTVWMAVWVSIILSNQGPQNFFWLCNMAQFLVLYGVWTGNRLILSSQAGMVTIVGTAWTLDFTAGLLAGGNSPLGFTAYMFSNELSLIARSSSLYHVGVPPFLIWLLWHVGHDRRGPWLQCLIGAAGILGGWLFTEPYRNLNWVYEPLGMQQVWMPTPAFVGLLLVLYPLILFFPGDRFVRFVLARMDRRR